MNLSKEKQWEMYAERLGLPKHILGKWFNGKKIVGLNVRNRKFPVLLESRMGDKYKARAAAVADRWYSEVGI